MDKPRWQKDLQRFLPLKSQFMLSGNVGDFQLAEFSSSVVALPLASVIDSQLREYGYESVLAYDKTRGFYPVSHVPVEREADIEFMESIQAGFSNEPGSVSTGSFSVVVEKLVSQNTRRVALLVDFASRMVNRADALTADEQNLFTQLLIQSQRTVARPDAEGRPCYNTVLWVVNNEADLPAWLTVENPMIRHIPIAKPDHLSRRNLAPTLLQSIDAASESSAEGSKSLESFVEATEGLLLKDMMAITDLARSEGVQSKDIGEAVRRYKIGVAEDPWAKIDKKKVRDGEQFIHRRVKGQNHVVTHSLDIVKRAITGIGATGRGQRPRGVMFLAGPTGVGKTELAKTITELLFGDQSAYIRFDMSEFSAEHADQRLIGAPPGYVGYDTGGELTNAIREKPFSVVLFDEIEKAHPRILDKFLQILDDGVLTSGRGERVYFTEALIIFTSNLGIYRTDQSSGERVANVTMQNTHKEVEAGVRAEIDNYFKLVLNRPEILNRLGENILVFDFIREDVGLEIFDAMMKSIVEGVAESGITVKFDESELNRLRGWCVEDLSNGGRGIRNQLEVYFINPLARTLFDSEAAPGDVVTIRKIERDPVPSIDIDRSGAAAERDI